MADVCMFPCASELERIVRAIAPYGESCAPGSLSSERAGCPASVSRASLASIRHFLFVWRIDNHLCRNC